MGLIGGYLMWTLPLCGGNINQNNRTVFQRFRSSANRSAIRFGQEIAIGRGHADGAETCHTIERCWELPGSRLSRSFDSISVYQRA